MSLPLAFGEARATECRSLLDFSEATRKVFPTLRDYDSAQPQQFKTRTANSEINGVHFLAATLPEARTTAVVDGYGLQTFVFHLHGTCEFQIERKSFYARGESSAVLIPKECSWRVHALNASTVTMSVNPHQLRATAEAMLGPDATLSDTKQFESPAELRLNIGALSFHQIFRLSFSQMDSYSGVQRLLNASGLDDIFQRTLVLCAMPRRFIKESEAREAPINHRQLRRVCDYVMADLAKPISLTDLERLAHMSRRTLHNNFKKSFGISPMAWVREQRLLKAYDLLSKASEQTSVTQVLFSCGFTDASLFSAHYLHRFGEYPSATRARSASNRQMPGDFPISPIAIPISPSTLV